MSAQDFKHSQLQTILDICAWAFCIHYILHVTSAMEEALLHALRKVGIEKLREEQDKVIRAFVSGKDMFAMFVLCFVAIHIRLHHEEDRLHSDICFSSNIADDRPTAEKQQNRILVQIIVHATSAEKQLTVRLLQFRLTWRYPRMHNPVDTGRAEWRV